MAPNDQASFPSQVEVPLITRPDCAEGGRQNIAVIGSGISGLAAAWQLAERHNVTLFEQDDRPGGHSHTVDLDLPEGRVPVDTGFIVFNERTYPNLTALFRHLGVASRATDMSFAASIDHGNFEYSGTSLRGLFAQRRNLLRPRMWRMISDILRFYRHSRLATGRGSEELTLGDYLTQSGYGANFIRDHLLPMGGAIWSTSADQMLQHPLHSFVRFCDNHGLLQLVDRPSWRTVVGGSRAYVTRLLADRDINLQLGARISAVSRAAGRPTLKFSDGCSRRFDAVILATHADQALGLIAEPTQLERRLLGAMRYQSNTAVLHGDTALMPRRRSAWSSWNVISDSTDVLANAQICVSYWMNRLQHLPVKQPVFVTLNPNRPIREDLTWATFNYAHPLFDHQAMAAQRQLWKLQGQGGIWFCGAYFGAGFHEDGLQAGLAVAERLGDVRRPWSVADQSGRIHVPDLPAFPDLVPGAAILAV
jgi:predicted NAD/FAD-binding protein